MVSLKYLVVLIVIVAQKCCYGNTLCSSAAYAELPGFGGLGCGNAFKPQYDRINEVYSYPSGLRAACSGDACYMHQFAGNYPSENLSYPPGYLSYPPGSLSYPPRYRRYPAGPAGTGCGNGYNSQSGGNYPSGVGTAGSNCGYPPWNGFCRGICRGYPSGFGGTGCGGWQLACGGISYGVRNSNYLGTVANENCNDDQNKNSDIDKGNEKGKDEEEKNDDTSGDGSQNNTSTETKKTYEDHLHDLELNINKVVDIAFKIARKNKQKPVVRVLAKLRLFLSLSTKLKILAVENELKNIITQDVLISINAAFDKIFYRLAK